MRRGQGEGTGILPRELCFAAKWLYELCFWFSMPDETVATRPPWLDSSLPRLPCRGISVLRSTILQPLSSFAMRSCGSMPVPSPCPRRTSLTLWLNINKKTRCSKLHLSDCRHSAPRNYVSRSLFLVSAKVFCLNKHIPTGFMPFVIPIPSYILQASLNSCMQK